MLKRLQRMKHLTEALYAMLVLIKNPNDLDRVFEISERVADPKDLERIGEHAAARSEWARKALEEFPRLDLKRLYAMKAELAPGSLGYEYLHFLEERKLDPADIPHLPATNKAEFVLAHLYETHDLWHVITGFETDVAGELGLQAFYLSQLPTPLSAVLLGAGFLNTAIFALDEKDRRTDEILRGWQMARSAEQLFGVDWNQYWQLPIAEVRRKLRLESAFSSGVTQDRSAG